MKYTQETAQKLVEGYGAGLTVKQLSESLEVPERSVIGKLCSLGVYQKKPYLNKRGEQPTKKSDHIKRIAELLDCNLELLDSLEKVNKQVLLLIAHNLEANSDPKQP